jgi:AraC family transcriptional regulator
MIIEHAQRTPRVVVEVRNYEVRTPMDYSLRFPNSCVIDLSLMSRPKPTRGRFEDFWGPSRSETIGNLLFVAAGLKLHSSGAVGRQRTLTCYFDPTLFTLDTEQLDDRALIESLDMQSLDVRRGLQRIYREAAAPTFASPIVIDAAAALVAVDVTRHLERRQSPRRRTGGLSHGPMRLIEERLRVDGPLPTLSELAAACGLSTRHLARAFRQETGKTVGEHVKAIGLERACELLRTTDMPIHAIAEHVGFSNATR